MTSKSVIAQKSTRHDGLLAYFLSFGCGVPLVVYVTCRLFSAQDLLPLVLFSPTARAFFLTLLFGVVALAWPLTKMMRNHPCVRTVVRLAAGMWATIGLEIWGLYDNHAMNARCDDCHEMHRLFAEPDVFFLFVLHCGAVLAYVVAARSQWNVGPLAKVLLLGTLTTGVVLHLGIISQIGLKVLFFPAHEPLIAPVLCMTLFAMQLSAQWKKAKSSAPSGIVVAQWAVIVATQLACGFLGPALVVSWPHHPLDVFRRTCQQPWSLTPLPFPAQMIWIPGSNVKTEASHIHVLPFWIDRREVTAFEFSACVLAKECSPDTRHGSGCEPVLGVASSQAQSYCRWRGARLATAQEWLAAAQGQAASVWPWGPAPPNSNRCCCGRGNWGGYAFGADSGPCEVGTHPGGNASSGVQDMIGNAAEWVTIDENAQGTSFKIMGGSWQDILIEPPQHGKVARSDSDWTETGIRCAQSEAPSNAH